MRQPQGLHYSHLWSQTGKYPVFEDPQIQRGMDLAKKWREEKIVKETNSSEE